MEGRGRGSSDLYEVHPVGAAPRRLDLVSKRFADAVLGQPDPTPLNGYCFLDIVRGADGEPYEAERLAGMCAVPSAYGLTGLKTFVIDVGGMVLEADTGGVPTDTHPELGSDDWPLPPTSGG